jgi:hypothetical protein
MSYVVEGWRWSSFWGWNGHEGRRLKTRTIEGGFRASLRLEVEAETGPVGHRDDPHGSNTAWAEALRRHPGPLAYCLEVYKIWFEKKSKGGGMVIISFVLSTKQIE